jgi:cysteine desulfuration protein SufE
VTPARRQQQLVEDLSILPDAFERLNHLVSQASKAEPFPEGDRHPEDLVEGCQAELWLTAITDGDQLTFRSHSDAPTVAALAHLYCTIYSGCTAEQIIDFEPNALEELGLTRTLTPNRQNGARQIVAKIKSLADASP